MTNKYKPRLIIFSGAGLSADSGINTFRGSNGIWENENLDRVCNMMTWKRNFTAVHNFYNDRRVSMRGVIPNAMHKLIAQWSKEFNVINFTQNIDQLLEDAGCSDVIHLHGNIDQMHCTACGGRWSIGYEEWDCDSDRCPECNSLKGVKPGVVFFNEDAPEYSKLYKILKENHEDDVWLIIGTSGLVIPIYEMCQRYVKGKVVVNVLKEDLTQEIQESSDVVVLGKAAEVVTTINEFVLSLLNTKKD